MKKKIFLILTISLFFVFGCGNDDENSTDNSTEDTTLFPGYEEFSYDDADEFSEDTSNVEVVVEEVEIIEEVNNDVMIENDEGNPIPATDSDLNDASKNFYIVVGSYQNINNAQERMKYFQKIGYTAEVLAKFGAYNRVSIASFNDETSARDELKSVRSKFNDPSYWLLYR